MENEKGKEKRIERVEQLLKYFSDEAEARKVESEARRAESKDQKEVNLAAINAAEKNDENTFQLHKGQQDKDREEASFNHRVLYVFVGLIIAIFVFSGYLIIQGDKHGYQLLGATITTIIGGFGGWGLCSHKKNKG